MPENYSSLDFSAARAILRQRLAEPPPGHIQLLAGPRQVGKTTLLLEILETDASTDPARFGVWVENACLAHAWNAGQNVSYWREEPFEVDAVIEGSWGAWVLEIKTRPVAASNLRGLGEFTKRFPKYRPLVLCDAANEVGVRRAGFDAMSWQQYLLQGPSV